MCLPEARALRRTRADARIPLPVAEEGAVPIDLSLALVALLTLWLVLRAHYRRRLERDEARGRKRVKVPGWSDVKVIERLPPRPLAFSATVRVSDDSDPDESHSVDLAELTCTCGEFRSRRSRLPPESVGRVCAHLSKALEDAGVTAVYDDLMRGIVESGPTHPSYYELSLSNGDVVAIGHDPDSDYFDVVARGRPTNGESGGASPYRHYGYSRSSRTWVGRSRPFGSTEAVKFMRGLEEAS